jgi:hypothetical protein
MATTAVQSAASIPAARRLPANQNDHIFFPAVAWLMLITVFIGFAPTYYLAGVFHAPLPSTIIPVHGAVFSCWILLLIAQTSLVAAGRVKMHRRLGIGGFLLASLMLIVGPLAATDALLKHAGPPGRDVEFFYIIPLTSMLIFGVLILCAFRARLNPAAHKRLAIVATAALMTAAIGRLHFAFLYKNTAAAQKFSYIFLLFVVICDLWSSRKIHRATLWACAFLIFVEEIRISIGRTGV